MAIWNKLTAAKIQSILAIFVDLKIPQGFK